MPERRRNSAFTLIELLAVIAIIVILIAILMPAFSKVQIKVATIYCFNNMRQLMSGSARFTSDNQGRPPSPNWGGGDNGERGWCYANGAMDHPTGLVTGLIWPYVNEPRAYLCYLDTSRNPADPYCVPWRPRNSRMVTSYCMNGSAAAFGRSGKEPDPDTRNWPGRWRWITYSLSQYRESDLFYWETWEFGNEGWWWDAANFPWEGITGRHNGGGVVGTVYGAAEVMTTNVYYALAAENIRNRLWNVPNSSNGR